MDKTSIIFLVSLSILTIIMMTQMQTKHSDKNEIIKKLVRGIARWSNASQQDKSPLIAVLHANYSAGYLWALIDIATDTEIQSATGVDIKLLTTTITKYQDEAHKKAVSECPQYMTHLDTYLSNIAGES